MRAFVSSAIFAAVVSVTGVSPAVQKVDEKSVAKEKSEGEPWLPKPKIAAEGRYDATTLPPSTLPELKIIAFDLKNDKDGLKREADRVKKCPRLFGTVKIEIDSSDDTARKLLKARLYQGTLEYQSSCSDWPFGLDPVKFAWELLWFADMQDIVAELYSTQPKELVGWLEELLMAGKDFEATTLRRAQQGAIRSVNVFAVSRTRLKIESELLKAKNKK